VGARDRLKWAVALGAVVVLGGAIAWYLLASGATDASPGEQTAVPSIEIGRADILLVVAGDIACAPGNPSTPTTCHQASTASLLGRSDIAGNASGAVLLGDIQYESGRTVDFGSFRDTWGASLAAAAVPMFPTPGNHEWYDPDAPPAGCRLVDGDQNACGYEGFFGAGAFDGDVSDRDGNRGVRFEPAQGRHPLVLILMDAGRCEHDPADCSTSSPAASFLRSALQDPAFNPPGACVVVGWHQARWSDNGHGDLRAVDGLWRTLFEPPPDQRPDLVLNGHDHLYERMPRLGMDGQPNDDGIAEVIVGAGGREIADAPYVGPAVGRAAYVDAQHFGVLALTEDPVAGTLTTTFLTEAGEQVDRTTQDCRV
jgi:acid phosphatase type 7